MAPSIQTEPHYDGPLWFHTELNEEKNRRMWYKKPGVASGSDQALEENTGKEIKIER